jgi:hypothetical protein
MDSNSSLFLAILAMDAYDRTGGNVTSVNLVVTPSSVGNVNVSTAAGDNSTGFFAQSYVDQATGQKIISYRGTDFFSNETRMQIDGRMVDLAPGMAVTVEIKTGTRRIIEYLMSPLLRYRQESLRER